MALQLLRRGGCSRAASACVARAVASARGFSKSGPSEPDAEVVALSNLSTQTIVDALWLNAYPQPYIHGARAMVPGMKVAGRAVTLRFVPHRPDIAVDKPQGVKSPEYVAFELCGPGQVRRTRVHGGCDLKKEVVGVLLL
jgi:hypothetical protein